MEKFSELEFGIQLRPFREFLSYLPWGFLLLGFFAFLKIFFIL
jgi:hypothetical protein